MRRQPVGDVGNHGWIDMLRRFVFRRCGWTSARKEEMVVGVVDTDRDIGSLTEARLPPGEIVLDSHLIVAATLEDEHRFAQRRSSSDRVVVSQVKPIRRLRGQRVIRCQA